MTPKFPIEDMPDEFRKGYREGLFRVAQMADEQAGKTACYTPTACQTRDPEACGKSDHDFCGKGEL